jgi:hypothetical protein
MPLEPPVMTAIFPSSFDMTWFLVAGAREAVRRDARRC